MRTRRSPRNQDRLYNSIGRELRAAAKTGGHLRIESFGEKAMGVVLHGDPRKPEPESFRVEFPGGIVDLERCSDNSYWVHVICNLPAVVLDREGPDSGKVLASFTEARMHMTTKPSSEADLGDFGNAGLYDVALRVVRSPGGAARRVI